MFAPLILADSVLEGALRGGLKGAIIGAIVAPIVWLVLKASQRGRKPPDDNLPPEKND